MKQSRIIYFHSGLKIESEWAIREWAPFEVAPEANLVAEMPDVSIRLVATDFRLTSSDYKHDVPGVASFVIRGGTEIVVIPEPGSDPDQVNLCLTASAWGALCYRRGLHVLHGSAVRRLGRVFAFSGHSGAGKSTLVAWLHRDGYEVLVDDTSRMDISGANLLLYPASVRIKLWETTVQAMGREVDDLDRVASKIDKFYVPIEQVMTKVEPVVLNSIYVLEWGELSLSRLTGAEAVQRYLSAATYRAELLDAATKQAFIKTAIHIVRHVPIYELSRPRDLSMMEPTIAMLEKHWDENLP